MAPENTINPDDLGLPGNLRPAKGPVSHLWEGETKPHDFLHTSSGQGAKLQTILTLHQGMAQQLAKTQTRLYLQELQQEFKCECASQEAIKGNELSGSLKSDEQIIFTWKNNDGGEQGLFIFDRLLFFHYYEFSLGGNRPQIKTGALSTAERTYLQRFIEPIIHQIQTGWAGYGAPQFATQEIFQTNEDFERMKVSDEIVRVVFSVQMGETTSQFQFVFPQDMLGRIGTEKADTSSAMEVQDASWFEAIWGAMAKKELPLRVELGSLRIPLEKVTRLQVGDEFPLEIPPKGYVALIDGRKSYHVTIGATEENRAVQITDFIRSNEGELHGE